MRAKCLRLWLKLIALLAASLALPLQLFGYATTCTMGDSDSAVTGSILSAPLLAVCGVMLIWALFTKSKRARPISTVLVLTATLALTSGIWFDTLAFRTPCGPDFIDYADSAETIWLILIGYLILPSINIALCFLVVMRTRHVR